MSKGWYGKSMEHGLASRGIKSRMRVGFTNLGGLLGTPPNSVEEIMAIRNEMIRAKNRNDIDALYIAIMRIAPANVDPDSNIEYIYNEHSLFHHPETEDEFKKMYEQMFYFRDIDDIDGLYITALQILPDTVKEVYTDEVMSDEELEGLKEDFGMAKGWHGKRKEHGLASKGVKTRTGSKLVWTDVETYRKKYEGYDTNSLVKMADNLDNVIKRRRVYPKGLNPEQKEEYIENVNKFQAMTLELDRRGVDF